MNRLLGRRFIWNAKSYFLIEIIKRNFSVSSATVFAQCCYVYFFIFCSISVAVVVAFFLCWAPFHAQRLLTNYVKVWTPPLLHVQSTLFYISGMCEGPVATFILNSSYFWVHNSQFRLQLVVYKLQFTFNSSYFEGSQSSQKVQDCLKNWHFFILSCKTFSLSDKCPVNHSKEHNILTTNMPSVLQILICPAKDYSLSDSCLASVEKISRRLGSQFTVPLSKFKIHSSYFTVRTPKFICRTS